MKIFSFLLISIGVLISVCSHSQSIKADSLFQEKKYMEALQQYDSVFNAGFYSESMILKMAYINEGLGRNEEAIYYLKFLNRENPSLELQRKIEELAVENGFAGYSYDDLSVVQLWLKNHYRVIILVSLSILVFCVLLMLVDLKKGKLYKQLMPLAILAFLVLVGFSSFKIYPDEAIITKTNSVVYAEESELSEKIKEIKKGNIVTLLNASDTWNKVELDNEQQGFVKSGKVKLLLN